MMTYSLPIAALFATTMVYGRLSADNELTACRASGISHLSIAAPALVLGLSIAIVSLLFLSFIVPVFTLKVERVIYSNLAQLVASEIQRTHRVRIGSGAERYTIFAQDAHVPAGSGQNDEQVVILRGLMIMTYEPVERDELRLAVPREFWMARQATVYIRPGRNDDVTFDVALEGGMKFPRDPAGGVQGGIEMQQFGPFAPESPIRERTKFMDIRRLKELHADLGRSSTIRARVADFVRNEQQTEYLRQLAEQLEREGTISFATAQERFVLQRATAAGPELAGGQLFDLPEAMEPPPDGRRPLELRRGELVIPAGSPGAEQKVHFVQERDGAVTLTADATEVRVRVWPDNDNDRLAITLELHDALVQTDDAAIARSSFPRHFSLPMPADIRRLRQERSPEHYIAGDEIVSNEHRVLKREMYKLRNSIQSEMHARASFAVSCLVLVMVGSALGMMFRSGNFLSAFGLSVIPALITIALIVTGQKTAENIPWALEDMRDPLAIGLGIIWSGNVAVLAIGVVLLGKLQRK
jgi:hypothetical protein